jgi:hypothetical protein
MTFFYQIVFLSLKDVKEVKEYLLRSRTFFASAVKYFRWSGRNVLPGVGDTGRLTKEKLWDFAS